jgi:phage shock protein A
MKLNRRQRRAFSAIMQRQHKRNEDMRDSATIQQEYGNLCFNAGELQLQADDIKRKLGETNGKLRLLLKEYQTAKAFEANKKILDAAPVVESPQNSPELTNGPVTT